MITRKIAAWGSSTFLIIFTTLLIISIQNSAIKLMTVSIIGIIIYTIGLIIVVYDYYKYG